MKTVLLWLCVAGHDPDVCARERYIAFHAPSVRLAEKACNAYRLTRRWRNPARLFGACVSKAG